MKRHGCKDCKLIEPVAGAWRDGLCPICTEARKRKAEGVPAPRPQSEDATAKRLTNYLKIISDGNPGAWRAIDKCRELRDWPAYVYLPLRRWPETINLNDNPGLLALASWRPTQGIYRFDPDVLPALWDTPVGDLPVAVLRALPEWCCYIECAGMPCKHPASDNPVLGYWVWMDYDVPTGMERLYFTLDDGRYLSTITPLTLAEGGLSDAIERTIAEVIRSGVKIQGVRPEDRRRDPAAVLREAAESIPHLIGPVLYLCSTNAEIRTRKEGLRPSRPKPVKTKEGSRIFPPNQPVPWDVGWRIGAAIRAAREQEHHRPGDGTHASPRPHIRRAHWHSFWIGPKAKAGAARTEERKLALRWLPPIAVNVEDEATPVPTVHQVQ